jgi:hypothetical protein
MWRRADLARVCESVNKQAFPLRRIVRQMGMAKFVLEDSKKIMHQAGLSDETSLEELTLLLGVKGEENIKRLEAIRESSLSVFHRIEIVKDGLDHEQQLALAINSKTSTSSVAAYIKLFEGQVVIYEENALRHVEVDKIEKRNELEKAKSQKDKDTRTRGGKRGGNHGRGGSNSERGSYSGGGNYSGGNYSGGNYSGGHNNNNNFTPASSSTGFGGGFGGGFNNAAKPTGGKMCQYNCGQPYTPSHQCPNKPSTV